MDIGTNINLYLDKCTEQKKNDKKFEKKNNDNFDLNNLSTLSNISNRNIINYIFYDRYNVIFPKIIVNKINKIKCTSSDVKIIKYNIYDDNNEISTFKYKVFSFNNKNLLETNIDNFYELLNLFINNNNPPYLSLLYKYNLFYIIEMIPQVLENNILSTKNSNDLIFQILFVLMCIYYYNFKIENFKIQTIYENNPVTLIFNVGNISFKIKDVRVFPIINFSQSIIIQKENDNNNLCKSYNKIVNSYLKIHFSNNNFPLLDEDSTINPSAFILSYLLQKYSEYSNICLFASSTEIKGSNNTCLNYLKNNIGTVYEDDDNNLIICVGNQDSNLDIVLDFIKNDIYADNCFYYKRVYSTKENLVEKNQIKNLKNIQNIYTFNYI